MSDRHQVGTWVKLPAVEVVEVLATAGLDFVIIDLEHGAIDLPTASHMIGVAHGVGIRPFVRVAGRTPRDVQPVLDAGAAGIVVPRVDDPAIAREAVDVIRFPPLGRRGASPSGRAGRWGSASLPDYLATGSDVVVVVQVESWPALSLIGSIAAVPGVDAVFIGAVDLAASRSLSVDDPELRHAIDQAEAVCRQGGHRLGGVAADGPDAAGRFARGYSLLTIGTDINFLRRGAAQAAAQARAAAMPDPNPSEDR